MKKYLITGSSGLIGSRLIVDLVEENNQVFSCYKKSKPILGNFVHLDLNNSKNIKNVLSEIDPDIIFHLGAITNVDQCEKNPSMAQRVNVDATKTIVTEAEKLGSFLIYVSTDYVFDGKRGMYKENDLTAPLGIYGKTKLKAEKEIQKSKCNWCIARTSTPFGIHPTKKSFPIWVIENLSNKKKVNVFTDQFTSPTYVPNLCKMLIEISEKKITGILNVSGATRISRFDFAKKIVQSLDLDMSLITPILLKQSNLASLRPKDSSLDISLAKKILHEKPIEIEYGLNQFLGELKK